MRETAEVWQGRAAQAWRIAEMAMLPPDVLQVVRDYASECDERAAYARDAARLGTIVRGLLPRFCTGAAA